jgi:N-acetylmuramoyl-L-alanine amidase
MSLRAEIAFRIHISMNRFSYGAWGKKRCAWAFPLGLAWFVYALARFSVFGASEASSAPPDINLRVLMVPPGKYGRHIEFPLHARYITIHSTDNPNATAYQHAIGMARGRFRARTRWNRTGYLTWHFTVDDKEAIQSLPLTIQGEHADHDGPGNRTSIGIEICEFRNRTRQAKAIDRAARLTAWLMYRENIPLDHVVPHWYWPQWHFHGYRKNCPRILLQHGRPGPKWEAFLQKIAGYYQAYYGRQPLFSGQT